MRCSLVSSVFHPSHASRPAGPGIRSSIQRFMRGRSLAMALGCAVFSGAMGLSASASQPSQQNQLVWSDQGRLNNQAFEAMAVLKRSPEHGLPPARYALQYLTELAQQLASDNSDTQAEQRFNELLTAALDTYAVDLLQGLQPKAFKNKHDPKYVSAGGATMQSQLQAGVLKGLHRSITTNRVAKFLASIEPQHSDYEKLQAALALHRKIAAHGGWPEVPRNKAGTMLQPGDVDPRVAVVRERLSITAEFDQPKAQSVALREPIPDYAAYDATTPYRPEHFYDAELAAAVRAFQLRHGLKDDAKVGKSTRAALNVSVEDRIRQLELNLDRWRLMPKVMPANHIWVNVPEYQLRLQIEREEILDMRVIVGKRRSPTVMMHDQLDHIVFNPYWYPTRNISVGEILPKVKADPSYLTKKSFEVLQGKKPIAASQIDWDSVTAKNFKYRFRQRPGRNNSLGEVKFMFPNRYSIYLHDTNVKSLFNKPQRAFSHGCVRLQKPDALAAAVLAWDRGWNHKNVARAMTGNKQKHIKLKQTLPVYLVYFTASVDNDRVYFHPDIYGHDARHTAAQEAASPTLVAQLLARYNEKPSNKQPAATTAAATTTALGRRPG